MSTHTDRTPQHPDHGFSLMEVLVVVVVLGILATIVVFAVRNSAADAEAAAYAADARTLETAQEAYAATSGSYGDEDELVAAGHLRQPSDLHDIVLDGGGFRVVRADGGSGSAGGPGESAGGAGESEDATGESAGPGGGNGVSDATTTMEPATTTTVPVTTTMVTTTTAPATTTTAPSTTTLPAATSTAPSTTAAPAAGTSPAATPSGTVVCALTVTQAWGSGANAALTITNATDRALSSWVVRIDDDGYRMSFWDAKANQGHGTLNVSNRKHNGTVPATTTTTVSGVGIRGDGLRVGDTFPCDVVTPKPDLDDLECELDVTGTWKGGGRVRLLVENDGDVDVWSWTVEIETDDVNLSDWSGADVVDRDDDTITLSSQQWTAFIGAGDTQRSVTAQAAGELGKKTDFDCEVVRAD